MTGDNLRLLFAGDRNLTCVASKGTLSQHTKTLSFFSTNEIAPKLFHHTFFPSKREFFPSSKIRIFLHPIPNHAHVSHFSRMCEVTFPDS